MSDKDSLNRSVLSAESAFRKADNKVKECEKAARSRRSDYSASLTRLNERPKNKRAQKGVKENKDRLHDAVDALEEAQEAFVEAGKVYEAAVKARNDFGKPKKKTKKKKTAAKKAAPPPAPEKPEPAPAAPTTTEGNGAAAS